ncbi:pyridoxamine 5'-phosphate oxidase family protein [Acidovorax sp. SUPP1855]|uniref:pyridoxamine 5'-phosphate oxidase family protein n=1 Tax=Acidovorax sp. SUPP1855 TaxID=431774 RepID=UPI0023DE25D0|nr:pyridoxamine 5'-phosphate oxidase family protein [Acidovorax sp. SUPP1855]GKS83079.1 pyridoxamine 5'-phosphate oxidase family protein [Acidovorax sp. SUPP1855]
MSNDDTTSPHATLWRLIKDIRFGMLTHRAASGMLHAHPLTTQNKDIDEQSQLFFFIPRDGELFERLRSDSQVNVTYSNPEKGSYVSLSGAAGFIEDIAKKEALWSPMAKAWFPDGVNDPNLVLLAIHISHAEYWDVKESKMTQLFKMAKAAVTGNPPKDMGEHKELSLS